MLEEVRITGLGVIDDAVLELSSGFTALTGETGAGKTMVVTALGLLFGGRADPARVRPGAARAAVEGRLLVTPEVAREVEEAGGDLDDNGSSLVLSRSVSAEGRSRAFAGGHSVPVSLLQVLADDLVAVHGQSDQQLLLKPGRQRDALDRFGGPELAAALAGYRRVYHRHRAVRDELDALTRAERERAAEAETLRLGLAEVEATAPEAGEDSTLLAEEEKLANSDALHAAATTAHEALLGDPASASASVDASDVVTLLGVAVRALEPVSLARPGAGFYWPPTGSAEASYPISDVAYELASYTESLDSTRPGWPRSRERRPRSAALIRAYAASSGDLAAWGSTGPSRPGRGWPSWRGRRQDRRAGRGGGRPAVRGDPALGGAADWAASRSACGAVRVRGDRRADRAGHAPRVAHRRGQRAGRARPLRRRRRGDQAGRAPRRAAGR
jgi:DNA repair protein RecN (Recombination protein N)